MADKKNYGERSKVCGLWKREANGKTYLGGSCKEGARYSIWPNGFKGDDENKPDYQLYVQFLSAEGEAKPAGENKKDDFSDF